MAKAHAPDLWDSIAGRYDGMRPDQGLTDPAVRQAWSSLLARHLPESPCAILDIGCGTGSLSLLLAEDGHVVTGIDFAPAMIEQATLKAAAAGANLRFAVQDGAAPAFPAASFDAIVCRQALWAMPDRALALANWATLLRDGGRLILVEGLFASGNGMSEAEIAAAFPQSLTPPDVSDISGDARLWGGPIPDQRLLVTASRTPAP